MLAVSVDLHRDVVSVAKRVEISRLHGAANAEVERKIQDERPCFASDPRSLILRAVVDDQCVDEAQLQNLGHDRGH